MTGKRLRLVLDTNVLLSALIWRNSLPAQAYRRAIQVGDPLLSLAVRDELYDVFTREKFDQHAPLALRMAFVLAYVERAVPVSIVERVSECRDIKDDHMLELALNGDADVIITGDKDLLALHPWRSIPIITPVDYLNL